MYHTIGQRQGLGIGGLKTPRAPWYVVDKEVETNTLWVCKVMTTRTFCLHSTYGRPFLDKRRSTWCPLSAMQKSGIGS